MYCTITRMLTKQGKWFFRCSRFIEYIKDNFSSFGESEYYCKFANVGSMIGRECKALLKLWRYISGVWDFVKPYHSFVGFVTTDDGYITLRVCCAGLHLNLKSRSDHWERKGDKDTWNVTKTWLDDSNLVLRKTVIEDTHFWVYKLYIALWDLFKLPLRVGKHEDNF